MIFLIHTYKSRRWYVDEFLVPSLLRQGIDENSVYIYDDPGDGNLKACLKSYLYYGQIFPGEKIWNLQDDILICRDFAERCKRLSEEHDIVYGYCGDCGEDYKYDISTPKGTKELWWSQPCIMMSGKIMNDISDYFWTNVYTNENYILYLSHGICDDIIVNDYVGNLINSGIDIWQERPSLVEHIDYLIGGSLVNNKRPGITKAIDFPDPDLVEELKNYIS